MRAVILLETHLSTHLPDLSPFQRTGLAYGVVGTALVGSTCLNAVLHMLASAVADQQRQRQLLRMWMWDRSSGQGWYSGPVVAVRIRFAPLLPWNLSLWLCSKATCGPPLPSAPA